MKDDDSLEENLSTHNPKSTPFEKEKVLREMQGGAILVNLDWSLEQHMDHEPENGDVAIFDRETF